jgi:predicted DsbA family dithiol-disulfide isomerase
VGYELHPETPTGGVSLAEWLPNAEAMLGYVRTFAASFGITDLRPPVRLANTRRALAVAQLARAQGRLDAFRDQAFDAYWRRGGGLEADEDLRAIARAAGMDPDAAVVAAADPGLLAQVDAARRAAREAGVTGIPCFDFHADGAGAERGLPVRVVGCQRYELLADAARRAGARGG